MRIFNGPSITSTRLILISNGVRKRASVSTNRASVLFRPRAFCLRFGSALFLLLPSFLPSFLSFFPPTVGLPCESRLLKTFNGGGFRGAVPVHLNLCSIEWKALLLVAIDHERRRWRIFVRANRDARIINSRARHRFPVSGIFSPDLSSNLSGAFQSGKGRGKFRVEISAC